MSHCCLILLFALKLILKQLFSAGAGRTGTFIAVNQLLQKLDENTEFLDVFNTVLNLRKQRVRLVQNEVVMMKNWLGLN